MSDFLRVLSKTRRIMLFFVAWILPILLHLIYCEYNMVYES